MSQMIDVSLESLNLWYVVLFFLLKFFDHELGATHVLFHIKTFLIQLGLLLWQLLYGLLVPLVFNLRISIVLQNVLFFHFKGSDALLCKSFLVLQLFILSLQEFVCLSWFCEFCIDKLIFSGQSLNILGELANFSGLDLNDLILMLNLLSVILVLQSQALDLIFSFK